MIRRVPGRDPSYAVQMDKHTGDPADIVTAAAPTAPLALCRAALRASGYQGTIPWAGPQEAVQLPPRRVLAIYSVPWQPRRSAQRRIMVLMAWAQCRRPIDGVCVPGTRSQSAMSSLPSWIVSLLTRLNGGDFMY